MTATAVTDDVDYYVLLELLAEFKSKARYTNYSLWVIAIHVENWRLDSLGNVGGVNS